MKTSLSLSVLLLATLFLLPACKKDSTKKNTTGAPVIESNFYFKAHEAGSGDSINIQDAQNGYINTYSRGGGVIDVSSNTYIEIQSGGFRKAGDTVVVSFIQTFTGQPGQQQIRSMFHEGDYDWGQGEGLVDSLKSGVEIILKGSDGKTYSTAYAEQPSDSYFTVTDHTTNPYDTYTPYLTKASFKCRFWTADSTGTAFVLEKGATALRTVVY